MLMQRHKQLDSSNFQLEVMAPELRRVVEETQPQLLLLQVIKAKIWMILN